MKRPGRYLWLALGVTILVIIVVAHLDEARSTFQRLLESFLKRPLASQMLIGFAIWLVSVIVSGALFWYLIRPEVSDVEDDTGGFGILLTFLVLWPPAWPIAVIVVLFMRLTSPR